MTAALAAPLLLLAILETGLYLFGFGHTTRFTVPCEVDKREAFCENHKFGWLFFPARMAREPKSFVIPASKADQTYRIFVFGGSAAEGDPEPTFGFSRILEVMLQHQYPGVHFEVINTAMTSINSHVVYRIAKDIAPHKGDLFIVHLGNNEVVGPYGAGTVLFPLSPNLSLIRAGLFLKSTRTGQFLESSLSLFGSDRVSSSPWLGMEMFLQNQIRENDPKLEIVYSHLERNFQDIIETTQNAGAKILFSTVATNLRDTAPFASLHRTDISEDEIKQWDVIYQSGIELETAGQYMEAVKRYLEAEAIDEEFADLHYRLGRSYWALGDYPKARDRYIRARDLDTLRFRADSRINRIIRSIAEGRAFEGIYLADSVRILDEQSSYRIPGNDLFYEHAHFTFKGNYMVAKALFKEIEKFLPEWMTQNKADVPLLTEDESAKRLAFTGYDRYRILVDILQRIKRPPFSNQLDHAEQYKLKQQEMEELRPLTQFSALKDAALQYRQAIQMAGFSDPWLYYNYARMLQHSRNFEGAAELLNTFLHFLPQYYPAYDKLAAVSLEKGNLEEAIAQAEQALQIKPNFYEAEYTKASALAQLGRINDSLSIYRSLLPVAPEMRLAVHHQIGLILIHQGRFLEAAEHLQEAVTSNKETGGEKIPDIYASLGYTLKQLGRLNEASTAFDQAEEEYHTELSRYPESGPLHAGLGNVLVEKGNLKEAINHFREAADLAPDNLNYHLQLMQSLEAQGFIDEALEVARSATERMEALRRNNAVAQLQSYTRLLKSLKASAQ